MKSGNVKAWRANGKAQLQQKPAWEFTLAGGCGAILCQRQEGASSDLAKMAVAAMTNDMSDFSSRCFESTQSVENLGFYIGNQTNGEVSYVNAKGQKKIVISVANSMRHVKLSCETISTAWVAPACLISAKCTNQSSPRQYENGDNSGGGK